MTTLYTDELKLIVNQFIELKKLKKDIYFKVLSGKYKSSILRATNISADYLSVQAVVFAPFPLTLSFKFYEIHFLGGTDIVAHLKINKSEDSNVLIDKLKNKIKVGDYITFTSPIFRKSDNLQFAEIVEISSNKKVLIKTIPQILGEKSITLHLRYKKNFLKLSEDQINNLVFNKISK